MFAIERSILKFTAKEIEGDETDEQFDQTDY